MPPSYCTHYLLELALLSDKKVAEATNHLFPERCWSKKMCCCEQILSTWVYSDVCVNEEGSRNGRRIRAKKWLVLVSPLRKWKEKVRVLSAHFDKFMGSILLSCVGVSSYGIFSHVCICEKKCVGGKVGKHLRIYNYLVPTEEQNIVYISIFPFNLVLQIWP